MKAATRSLLAFLLLDGAQGAFAQTSAPEPEPVGSPANWIQQEDYPPIARRLHMTGVTKTRLTIDLTGKPSRCEVIESSGFDVLDTATCERLMANARYTPSQDEEGKPIDGSVSGRVRWELPDTKNPTTESFASMSLLIGPEDKIMSCRLALHVPVDGVPPDEEGCRQFLRLIPREAVREIRGSFTGPSAEVEIRNAYVFTPALRAQVLAPTPGYEQRALNIHHFTVKRDGTPNECRYEEQRGNERLAKDTCAEIRHEKFDPPFSAFDKNDLASGWYIERILLKTGE